MQPPFPCPTATWHNDTYAAINPLDPQHNQEGRTVIITGAGSGIGRATALAFCKAGAKNIVLIGRNEQKLLETQKILWGSTSVYPCSVTDEAKMKLVAEQIGKWDVLVLDAAHISTPAPITNAPLDEWWADYEVNVKSIVIAAQAFIPTKKAQACLFALTAGALAMPPQFMPGISGYISSKVAQVKVIEFLAAENPEIFICSVHPGMVDTEIFRDSGATPDKLPMDTVELPAHFLVYLAQKTTKLKFLQGRMVWANWDVDELWARSQDVLNGQMLTIGLEGWPRF